MSNFIYNSYCVVHPGAEQISLTAEYRPVQEAAAPVRRSAHFSFVWPLVAVMAPQFAPWRAALAAQAPGGPAPQLNVDQLAATRQVLVASRDPQQTDPRFVFAHQQWRTDSHQAALSLISTGLAWGWLPKGLVETHIAAGTLLEIPVQNLSNGTTLFVDWVWSKERPLGLAAQRFVHMLRERPAH